MYLDSNQKPLECQSISSLGLCVPFPACLAEAAAKENLHMAPGSDAMKELQEEGRQLDLLAQEQVPAIPLIVLVVSSSQNSANSQKRCEQAIGLPVAQYSQLIHWNNLY